MIFRSLPKTSALLLFLACSITVLGGWQKQEAKTFAWLHDVFFLNENKGWIAGSNGEFIQTADGGRTWIRNKKFTEDTIQEVHFFDENNGWLLCDRDVFTLGSDTPSYLLVTADGGKSWKTVNFTGNERKRITKIFFARSKLGLAIGESGAVFSVGDSETDWKRVPSPAQYLLNDGTFIDNFRGAIVGGGGTILFTEDAGVTWKPSVIAGNENKKLNSIFFLNQNTGWAVGAEGSIFQTLNSGKIWRKQNAGSLSNLNDIHFVDSAHGWAIGDNGTILESETAGNVWNQVKINTKNRLEKILFVGNRGWIVGFGGTILFYEDENPRNSGEKLLTQ
jgi:photosystem II stability/assembly factor-like uncharacterized protein